MYKTYTIYTGRKICSFKTYLSRDGEMSWLVKCKSFKLGDLCSDSQNPCLIKINLDTVVHVNPGKVDPWTHWPANQSSLFSKLLVSESTPPRGSLKQANEKKS